MARWSMADVVAAKRRVEAHRTLVVTEAILQSQSKYGNKKTNGYASKREARRALNLKAMLADGLISDLREQVPFELIPKQSGERSCKYIADFVYADSNGTRVVEDAKGYRDPVYRIKRKLMLKVHGIRIREV